MKVFEHINDFEQWLDENYGFEDGYISEIKTYKNEQKIIDSVEIRIGYQSEGTLDGRTPITLKEYILKARNIKLWTFNDSTNYNPGNCICGIDTIDDCDGIGIELGVPDLIKLICDNITVEGPFLKKSIQKPWVSEQCVSCYIKEGQIPTPSEWIIWLNEIGFDVSWRYGAGEAKLVEKIPYPDYAGWFLQETNRIPTTQFGVLFRNVGFNKEKLSLSLQKYDSNIDELWHEIIRILALKIQKVEIFSGNCRFGGNEWLEYLNSKTIPEDMYGWE